MEENNYDVSSTEESTKKGKLKRQRNLVQYKDLSDEQFDKLMEKKTMGGEVSKSFEDRILKKLEEYAEDYDLSDLKINDRDTLRALIQAQLALEDHEQYMYLVRSQGISDSSSFANEKLGKFMSDLRSDISKFQQDLNITRKVRKSDQDVSVLAYIEGLKDKAKKFYQSKMGYIFCEKCNMLLSTVWSLYAEEDRNKLSFVCHRKLEDGSECGHKTVVSTKQLIDNRGTNKLEIFPESMK